MFSKEKFNEMIDDLLKDLSDSDKQQMYDAMYEKCYNHRTETNKESKWPHGMNMKGGARGGMMMEMMSAMMSGRKKSHMKGWESPMSRCMDMMSGMKEKSENKTYTPDELMDLFKDWCGQIEDEIVSFINETGEIDQEKIADKFHLSKESVSHLLKSMEKAEKIKGVK